MKKLLSLLVLLSSFSYAVDPLFCGCDGGTWSSIGGTYPYVTSSCYTSYPSSGVLEFNSVCISAVDTAACSAFDFRRKVYTYSDTSVSLYMSVNRVVTPYETTRRSKNYDIEECIMCDEPDESLPEIDSSVWKISLSVPSKNSCSSIDERDIVSECSAIDGTIYSELRDCCAISHCFVPVAPLVCPTGQVDFNGICTNCPENSSPNTLTSCKCDTDFFQDNLSCTELPPCGLQEYRSPTTNLCTAHDCPIGQEPASSYESDASCVPIGNPPPDTPPDNNSCSFPCGQENGICADFQPHPTTNPDMWSHYLNWTSCSTCEDLTGEYSGRCPSFEEPVVCNYPPTMFTYPFQSIQSNVSECTHLQLTLANGFGHYFTCPDSTVACYFDLSDDDSTDDPNDGTPDPNDTNGSLSSDGNGSFTIDLTPITSRIDITNQLLSADGVLNKSLGDIGFLIDSGNAQNHTDLLSINDGIDSIKGGIDTMNSDLGIKLDGIGDSIDALGDRIDDIPDITEETLGVSTIAHNDALTNADNVFQNALATFQTTGSDLRALAIGITPPNTSYTGSCNYSISTSFGGTTISLESLAYFRAPLQFVLNLLLLFLTLKFYTVIARDIVGYFASGL